MACLIPLFGVFRAWPLLDEAITATMTVACMLILVGVGLSQQRAVVWPVATATADQRTGQ